MALADRITDLAARVAAEFKSVRAALASHNHDGQYAKFAPEWKAISGNYTLVPSDAGKVLVAPDSSAPTTITVLRETFNDMERVDIIALTQQDVSFVGDGVVLSAAGLPTARAEYSAMSLIWLDLEWALVIGDLRQP